MILGGWCSIGYWMNTWMKANIPLQVFDFKLRHMRDDIAAIEASNNSLERQARHNRELLVLLEGLLGGLHLDKAVVQQLEQTQFELQR